MRKRPNRAFRIHGPALMFAAGLALIVGPLMAADEGWQPPPPMPDAHDWIQTTSLEWLKGEIIAMYKDKLELELTSLLDFDITVIWDRTRDPRPDSDGVIPEQDDFRLVFFVGFDF